MNNLTKEEFSDHLKELIEKIVIYSNNHYSLDYMLEAHKCLDSLLDKIYPNEKGE